MSDTSQLLVRRIKDGTVVDHIENGKALIGTSSFRYNG